MNFIKNNIQFINCRMQIIACITANILWVKCAVLTVNCEAPANTDHVLVAADLVFSIVGPKRTDEVGRPCDVDRLAGSSGLRQRCSIGVQSGFDALGALPGGVAGRWESLCSVVRGSANEVIGPRKNIRQPWLSEDTYNIIQLKATAKCQQDDAERRRLRGMFGARAKADRNNCLSRIADEVEEDLQHNNMRSAFRAIKTLAGHGQSQPVLSCIQRVDGAPCRSNGEVVRRWSEHFAAALGHLPAAASASLESGSISALPDPSVGTDEPTVDEVVRAVGELRSGRAAGPDGVPPELLRCAIGPVGRALRSLFVRVWRSGMVPEDWREGVVVALCRCGGPRAVCGDCRPVALLSVPGRVFAHVLLARMQPLVGRSRRPRRSGFAAGGSTVGAVLALRLLSELRRGFGRPLGVAFLDIKSALDSVDRTALWKALRSKGIPDIILQLITALNENTGARIKVGQGLSSGISTASGVRQGCILAPILFCVAIDWMIQHMSFGPGITVGSSTFTDLVYADDAALLLPSATDAATSLKSFSDSASHLGLNISWPKTELQNIGSGPGPPDVSVDGSAVESVNGFVCLGDLQSSDGQCRPDLTRRIGLACAVMTSLKRIWSDNWRFGDVFR